MSGLLNLIVVLAVLLCVWWVVQRFSPDPLITKIVQVVIFLIALFVVLKMVLPMAGVSF